MPKKHHIQEYLFYPKEETPVSMFMGGIIPKIF
jgi:hypothetical protein